MRFRVPELFLGAFLAVAIFSMGMMFSSQYPSQSTQSNSPEKASGDTSKKEEPKPFWQAATADPVAAFTLGLLLVGVFQAGFFFVQLRLIRESLGPAKEAAEAAKLNAEAVMAAEGAQLFPIIKTNNLDEVFDFRSINHDGGEPGEILLFPPQITYRLKNYGKTPAKLQSIMHGIRYSDGTKGQYEVSHADDDRFLEVIGGGEESADIALAMDASFTKTMAEAVLAYNAILTFHGHAIFKDFFDREFRCDWKCDGRRGGFRLIHHEQRENPDKNRNTALSQPPEGLWPASVKSRIIALAMTIQTNTPLPSRGAMRPSWCMKPSAPMRAWGMPGARCTRSRVRSDRKHTR
jgi:hypothetical protein